MSRVLVQVMGIVKTATSKDMCVIYTKTGTVKEMRRATLVIISNAIKYFLPTFDWMLQLWGCLNINMLCYQYRNPHVKDETVARPSYL